MQVITVVIVLFTIAMISGPLYMCTKVKWKWVTDKKGKRMQVEDTSYDYKPEELVETPDSWNTWKKNETLN